jgi:Zn-finger protein
MERSSRYYENRACEYYPCHETEGEGLNCLFCYCPLYTGDCGGDPWYIRVGPGVVKDCSRCTFPHRAESYDAIMLRLMGAAVHG